MMEVVFKIFYIVVILPFIIFLEGSKMFANFLKKKNIYSDWDVWHSYLILLIMVAVVLWVKGYY